ncbi:type I restriction enzyme, S subunit [Cyclonatronum proteinivorum]|uniref:Type I restriction enzyme, S subunit n=1 Tax=Cyclonatronum proteinivorum TaxID=1457365 RepID=A0A345UJN5_9BACT|nr:restriction endonuclease subunit S [Cyclonatronum proteinivorum]AXJ00687.1 type I restriction enzyme, S subunit [Cyclonatronum proteinivorum]
MSKEKKLIPELRFPEFEKFGEWDRKTLEFVADSESSNLALNKIEHKENGYPVYGADSIVGYIDEYQQVEKYISIVKDGSGVGRLNLCIPKSSILGTLACIKSKDLVKFKLDWIYYLMNTIDFTSYKKGSGIPHIYFSDFKIEPIGVPQPQEQQKIASCLSSLDELLAAHNDKLDALKDHKKGLLQNLFPKEGETLPKVRFPEFEGDGEWVENQLQENCHNISSGKDKNQDDGEFDLYGSTGIIGKTENASYEGDYILVARVGANAGLLNRALGQFGVTDNTLVINLKDPEMVDFIFYSLDKIGLNKLVFGSGQPLVTGKQLKELNLPIPKNPKEQQKNASCLSAVDELITAQQEKIEQLQQHKKGLMQGLFPKIKT